MAARVVLGLGGGVDYEIKLSSPTLAELADEYRIRNAELTLSTAVTN